MKWFKHMTDSLDDPFIQSLLDKYSHAGYVAWFGLIEIICKENGANLTGNLKISPTFLKRKLRISEAKLRQVFNYCSTFGKLSVDFQKEMWVFSFPKILEIKDNYSKDLQVSCKKLSIDAEEDAEADKDKEKDKEKEKIISIKKVGKRNQKTYIPNNFTVSENVKVWAEEKGHERIDEHLEFFICACKAKGYQYINWDAAFMNAIRHNWASLDIVNVKKQIERKQIERKLDEEWERKESLGIANSCGINFDSLFEGKDEGEDDQ